MMVAKPGQRPLWSLFLILFLLVFTLSARITPIEEGVSLKASPAVQQDEELNKREIKHQTTSSKVTLDNSLTQKIRPVSRDISLLLNVLERDAESVEEKVFKDWFPEAKSKQPNDYRTALATKYSKGLVFVRATVSTFLDENTYFNRVKSLCGGNDRMGFLLSAQHLLFLDGLGGTCKGKIPQMFLSKIKEKVFEDKVYASHHHFKKFFPLDNHGLAIAIRKDGTLIISAFGNPPLKAIILRQSSFNLVIVTSQDRQGWAEFFKVKGDDLLLVTNSKCKIPNANEIKSDASSGVLKEILERPGCNQGLVAAIRIGGDPIKKPSNPSCGLNHHVDYKFKPHFNSPTLLEFEMYKGTPKNDNALQTTKEITALMVELTSKISKDNTEVLKVPYSQERSYSYIESPEHTRYNNEKCAPDPVASITDLEGFDNNEREKNFDSVISLPHFSELLTSVNLEPLPSPDKVRPLISSDFKRTNWSQDTTQSTLISSDTVPKRGVGFYFQERRLIGGGGCGINFLPKPIVKITGTCQRFTFESNHFEFFAFGALNGGSRRASSSHAAQSTLLNWGESASNQVTNSERASLKKASNSSTDFSQFSLLVKDSIFLTIINGHLLIRSFGTLPLRAAIFRADKARENNYYPIALSQDETLIRTSLAIGDIVVLADYATITKDLQIHRTEPLEVAAQRLYKPDDFSKDILFISRVGYQ